MRTLQIVNVNEWGVKRREKLIIVNELLGTSKGDGSSRTLVYTLIFITQDCCTPYSNEATFNLIS